MFIKVLSLLKILDGWSHVRGFANSRIIKLTMLMPVFGYLILFNQTLSEHFELSPQLVENRLYSKVIAEKSEPVLSIQTKYRLYAFYFGLTFIGFGTLVYAWKCPPIIKKYDSINTMISDHINTIDPVTANWYFQEYIKGSSGYSEKYKANLQAYLDEGEKEYKVQPNSDTLFRKAVKELFRDVWTNENFLKQKSLYFTAALFKIGILILAIPTMEMFINVIFSLF